MTSTYNQPLLFLYLGLVITLKPLCFHCVFKVWVATIRLQLHPILGFTKHILNVQGRVSTFTKLTPQVFLNPTMSTLIRQIKSTHKRSNNTIILLTFCQLTLAHCQTSAVNKILRLQLFTGCTSMPTGITNFLCNRCLSCA